MTSRWKSTWQPRTRCCRVAAKIAERPLMLVLPACEVVQHFVNKSMSR
jgi:hypothetical protein